MSEPSFYLKQLELGPMQNFIYLVGDPRTREAAVIDPGWEVPQILRAVEADGYRLTKAFVTHHHFDHVMGLTIFSAPSMCRSTRTGTMLRSSR